MKIVPQSNGLGHWACVLDDDGGIRAIGSVEMCEAIVNGRLAEYIAADKARRIVTKPVTKAVTVTKARARKAA